MDAGQAEAVARQLVPAWRRHSFDLFEYLPGGYTHRNYRVAVAGGEYALRIARAPPRRGEGCYLASAAAPEVVAHDAVRGHLATRWINGPLFARAPPTPAEAGAYLAALHRHIPAGVRRYDPAAEVRAMLGRAGDPDPALAELARRQAWTPTTQTGCHNDLNPWNILRGAGGIYTLDWEIAGDNDPLFDIVGLGVGLAWSLADMETCRRAYQSGGGHAPAELGRLRAAATLMRVRESAWALAQLAAGNDRAEIRAQAADMRAAAFAGERAR